MSANPIWIAGYFGPVAGAAPVWIAPGDGTVPSAVQSEIVSYYAPVAGATAVWIAGFFAPPPAAIGATPITISGWGGSGGGGGPPPVTSVWSAADAAANGMTLSNGGLTVTDPNVSWASIRTTIGKTNGKLYVEFYNTGVITGPQQIMFGLASAGFAASSYLGTSAYSGGLQPGTGGYASTGFATNYSLIGNPAQNDVWGLAIDFGAGSVWIAQNNGWANGQNPAAAGGPILTFTPATVGALFAAMSFGGAGIGTWTLQSTAASQKYAPPSGFSAWDGGAAPPPTSVWSAADAAANAMTLSNGGLTVTATATAWQSIRGTISKTSGKLYVEFSLAAATSSNDIFGLASAGFVPTTNIGNSNYSGGAFPSYGPFEASDGFTGHYNISPAYNVVSGDVCALAIDFATSNMWFAVNNVWIMSSNPATGFLPIISFDLATVGPLFPTITFNQPNDGVWTLQSTAASQKYLPPPGFQAWDGGPVTPVTSVWSAADAAAGNGFTLSNANLTASYTGGAGWTTLRTTIGKTSGMLYVEFSTASTLPSQDIMFGLASNSTFNIHSYPGSSNYSCAFECVGANFVSSGFTSNITMPALTIVANDVIALAVDFTNGKVWLAYNNVWQGGGNPATAASPLISFVGATVGALFACHAANHTSSGTWTLQSTAAALKYAPPSGFSAWDAP